MSPTARKLWTIAGVTAAVAVVGSISYGVASAALRGSRLPPPRYPTPEPTPGKPVPPLRPAPPEPEAPPPGPMAAELKTLIDGLSDAELQAVRQSMPPHWWDYILAATSTPSDPMFSVVMHPMSVDIGLWSDAQVDQLEDDLIASMGYVKAYKLRSILIEGGVIS